MKEESTRAGLREGEPPAARSTPEASTSIVITEEETSRYEHEL